MPGARRLLNLRLADGRELIASSYKVSYTWDGYLCYTNDEHCRQSLFRTIQHEGKHTHGEERTVHILGGLGEVEKIPRIRVITFFESPPMDSSRDASGLVCAWFQEKQFPCPDETAVKTIESLQWEKLASDFDW